MIRPFFLYLAIINLLAGLQGLFLAFELAGRKQGNSAANRMLALFILSFSIAILGTVLGATGWYRQLPHMIRVGDPFVFLFGPSLFLYIVLLRTGRWHWLLLVHFAPFWIYLISIIPFYMLPGSVKADMVASGELFSAPEIKIIFAFKLLLNLLYLILTLVLLNRHKDEMQEIYAANGTHSLTWIRSLIVILLIVWIAATGANLGIGFHILKGLEANILIAFVMAILIYSMGYKGLRQPDISSPVQLNRNNLKIKSGSLAQITGFGKKATTRALDNSTAGRPGKDEDHDLKILLDKMKFEKPFLQPDLTIESLSRICGIPVYLLSRLINDQLNENFFEFVNRYRIEEVKKRLRDADHDAFTILAIAFDCGFQSKSTFNHIFKKSTGMTPSAYRRQIKQETSELSK